MRYVFYGICLAAVLYCGAYCAYCVKKNGASDLLRTAVLAALPLFALAVLIGYAG